ncbi:MAG: BTAD domain-containing putative transcriptional regulator [Syntrophobacteraceae bacterium]
MHRMLGLLKQVPLFKSLNRKDMRFLQEIARQVEFPPHTILFLDGERGDRLYVIVDGELEILKELGKPGEHLLRVCGPGEHVGEMCFLSPMGARSAGVRTRTAVRLAEITRDDFELLLRGRPEIAFAVARGLSQRLVDSENRFLRILAEKNKKLTRLSKLLENSYAEPSLPEASEPEDYKPPDSRPGIPQIQIQVLGNFQVLRGESLIEEGEWKAKQPKLLLKALITRGAARVPKDVLMEDLWPEASQVSAERNFKVVLHRLRKALEPSMDKGSGSSYVFLRGNLLSLNRDLCRIDLDEFLALYRRAKKAEQAGDVREVISSSTSALALYTGEYLADDLYVPWAELKREELRTLHIALIRRTAELYESQGSSRKAIEFYNMIIKADPADEEAYQKLMLIYANRGMQAEARRVYEDCERALDREVGVAPGKLTVSIYKRIIENI